MPKTKICLHISSQNHKQASTLEFKNFDSILQRIFVTLDENGKSVSHQTGFSCAYAYVKHFMKFPDSFETQCWQPWNQMLFLKTIDY